MDVANTIVESVQYVMIFLVVLLSLRVLTFREKNYPPSPRFRLPFIGHFLLVMNSDLLGTLKQIRKKHGDIFRLVLGSTDVIVINGFDLLHKAFVENGDIFSARPKTFFSEMCNGNGIIGSNGETWQQQRRFAIRVLRDFGFGTSKIEGEVHSQVRALTAELMSYDGAEMDPKSCIQKSIARVIGSLIFGGALDVKSDKFKSFMTLSDENVKLTGAASIVNFFPILRFLPFDMIKFYKLRGNFESMKTFLNEIIEKHRLSLPTDRIPRDFIDAYLHEMERQQGIHMNSSFTNEQAVFVAGDLFVVGVETTETSLRWAIYYLATFPQIQKRLQDDLDSYRSNDVPNMNDIIQLPYVEAFIAELLRHSDVSPLGLLHTVTSDIQFEGYYIPRDAFIMPHIDSVLKDSALWNDPGEFRPERFLSPDGSLLKPKAFIPFFFGKRKCPAEHLAKTNLTLFVCGILQKFTVSWPTQTIPRVKGVMGITYSASPFKVCFHRRKK